MEENWKDVKGYEGLYQVSDLGNVKSLSRYRGGNSYKYLLPERLLNININNHGRPYVNLSIDGKVTTFIIHQLVAIAFLDHAPCGHKTVVDHIDNNPMNNKVDNLQLISARQNVTKDMTKGSSRFTGVFINKNNKWRSTIVINKIKKHLGYFNEEVEAYIAYENERLSLN